MDIVYYPNTLVNSETTLKYLLLFWEKTKTIVPLSEKWRIESYIEKTTSYWQDPVLERYKEIWDTVGQKMLDFIVITDTDKKTASESMFNLIADWNKDTHYYSSLRINETSIYKRSLETFPLFEDKMDSELRDLLISEKLMIRIDRQLQCLPQIGKTYMSIIAREMKRRHHAKIVTDDEFCLVSKSNVNLKQNKSERQALNAYQLVSIDIPQIFIPTSVIQNLTWKNIAKIRRDLIPLSEQYYTEIENYQNKINRLQEEKREHEALETLREFSERTAISFRPFSREVSKLFGLLGNFRNSGLLTDLIIPTLMLFHPEFTRQFSIASLAVTYTKYSALNLPAKGFDYLVNLNALLRQQTFKQTITRIVPKRRNNTPFLPF